MGPFIGFIVLTSPLFLIILWIPVCIALAVWIGRKFIKTGLPLKIVGGTLIFLVSMILPVADEIAGRIYFNHLCETEAGVKVYQTIELPTEFWNEQGVPMFYRGYIGNDVPSNAYAKAGKSVIAKSIHQIRLFRVEEFGSIYSSKGNAEVLSEVRGFRYWGGWLARNFSPHNSAISCGGGKSYDELVEKQFIPKKNTIGGKTHGNDR
jgi:hypothetical protein